MKKLLLLIPAFLLLMASGMNAQNQQANHRHCATTEYMDQLKLGNPNLEQDLIDAENTIQQYLAAHPHSTLRTSTVPDTIPVVVHVVWNTAAENISDAQIMSQIAVLNKDFARLNSDTVNTPVAFRPVAGRMPVFFQLARRDPNGLATTGIVRKNTSTTKFTNNNNVKHNSNGGDNSWNTAIYLNIWVCDLGNQLLGYGEYPTGTVTSTRGFVCNYNAFGTLGAAAAPYNKGRTTTHELGHCFNLIHIWGNNNCASGLNTDQCADTPPQNGENYDCPTYPLITTIQPYFLGPSCSGTAPGSMFMNYMDYTDDACMNIFTQDQVDRMNAAIASFYPNLLNSIALTPGIATGLNNHTAAGFELQVYPNPASGLFHVTSAELPKGETSIIVTNLLGAVVYNQSLKSTGTLNETIDLSAMNSGVYMMKISAGDKQTISKLIIE